MRTFKHILVPIDLSDRNARTLRVALMLASQSRARVTAQPGLGDHQLQGRDLLPVPNPAREVVGA